MIKVSNVYIYMNSNLYKTSIEQEKTNTVFSITDTVWNCVWKIIFTENNGRLWKIYKISLLGTANGWSWLDDVWLNGIYKSPEKVTWLLYIMFKLFIDHISSINHEEFTINICNPLLTLTSVYKRLYMGLLRSNVIDSWVINDDLIIFRHI